MVTQSIYLINKWKEESIMKTSTIVKDINAIINSHLTRKFARDGGRYFEELHVSVEQLDDPETLSMIKDLARKIVKGSANGRTKANG